MRDADAVDAAGQPDAPRLGEVVRAAHDHELARGHCQAALGDVVRGVALRERGGRRGERLDRDGHVHAVRGADRDAALRDGEPVVGRLVRPGVLERGRGRLVEQMDLLVVREEAERAACRHERTIPLERRGVPRRANGAC